jgi:hypothetical protein
MRERSAAVNSREDLPMTTFMPQTLVIDQTLTEALCGCERDSVGASFAHAACR